MIQASMLQMSESEVTIVSEASSFDGTLELGSVARMHGSLKGKLIGRPGSMIVIAESGHIDGRIDADTLWVDGFVRGEIAARTRVVLSSTARVFGNIHAPAIEIQPGATFEGRCRMES